MPTETFFNLEPEKQQRIMEAATDEFAERTFKEAKLSNIIRSANIPRGSFYQYFSDKKDLYKYLFDLMAQRKIEFMSDLLPNPEHMSFMDLFEELYIRGIKFAKSDPRFVKISRNLLLSGSNMMHEIFGDNLELGKQYYINYIETDKQLGRIRADVDTELLADFVMQTTTNIAFNEISRGEELDIDHMFDRVIKMITILKKGIE
jgi:AcrR family transcriptional regulator